MVKQIYTIYDRIACEMGPIMVYNNDEQAQRAYPQAFENNKVKREDFQLVRLGKIDINTMSIESEEIPEDVTPRLPE